jgi:hypothetical protein
MFRFGRLQVCLGAAAIAAAGLIGAAIDRAAASGEAPSLTEYLGAICSAAFGSASPADQGFLSETDSAMAKMMAGMRVAPTGDVDRDFVQMMVPHHQGAIDMAVAVLRYGRNERIRRLAQEIIVTQHQEIAAMRLAVGEPPPPSNPSAGAPPYPTHHMATRQPAVSQEEPGANK